MAIIENGINGGFTGTVGSVNGYYLNGKWVIRSKRRNSGKNKIGTAEQQACRNRFRTMQSFLSPIVGFIRIGFNIEAKKRMMSAHNVAKSYNMRHAQNAAGDIHYATVSLTFGQLIGAEGIKMTLDDAGLHFSWTDNSNSDYVRANDQVMLMAYDVENKMVFCETSGAKRSKGMETIPFPTSWEEGTIFHTWMAFISDDRMEISMSTYCGTLEF